MLEQSYEQVIGRSIQSGLSRIQQLILIAIPGSGMLLESHDVFLIRLVGKSFHSRLVCPWIPVHHCTCNESKQIDSQHPQAQVVPFGKSMWRIYRWRFLRCSYQARSYIQTPLYPCCLVRSNRALSKFRYPPKQKVQNEDAIPESSPWNPDSRF